MRVSKLGSIVMCLYWLAGSAEAAIQLQGFTDARSSTTVTSISVPTPAGTVAGDLLVVAIATDGGTSGSLAPVSAGWTTINVGSPGAVTLGVWWKLAGASEPSSHDFTWGASEQVYAWMMRFTGHDPTGPIDTVSTPASGVSTNPLSPEVITTVNDALVLRLGAFDDGAINVGVTGLAGHTDITMDESSTGLGATAGGAGYVLQPAAGASGTSSFSLTASEDYRTITLAIAPDGVATTSAVAEIDPNTVAKASTSNTFAYDILATILSGDTGVDEITVTVPTSFGLPSVADVKVGGTSVSYTDNSSGNLIRVSLTSKVTTTSNIQILFDADAPSCPEQLGRPFLSTVDDSATVDPPQNTAEGDADGDGGDNNSWSVTTTGTACWYGDVGFQYRKQLCLDGTQIPAELTDFPVLVSLDDADLSRALANGFDILFTSDDGVTRLDYERQSWSRATGSLDAWVRFPKLVPGVDETFYIYYGKPSELVDQQNPTGVWDPDYKAVWHLEESGSGTPDEFRDSTLNGNHAQGGDGVASETPTQTGGIIGNAQDFDGTDDFIGIPQVENDVDPNSGTISTWVLLRPTGADSTVLELRADALNEIVIWWDNSANSLQITYEAGGVSRFVTTTAVDDNSAWSLVTLTWNVASDEMKLFVNGAQVGSTLNGLGTWAGAFNGLGALGAQAEVGHAFEMDGLLDEVRISDSVRSAGWTLTSYNNQSNPATFLKCVGVEESLAASTATLSSSANQTFTVGSPAVNAVRITITDTTGGAVTDSGDIRIRIPAGFNMRWNSAVGGVGLTGSAVGRVDPTVKAYEDGDRTVVLDVTGDFAAGDQIEVDNLQLMSFTAPSPPDNLELELGNDDIISAFDDKTVTILSDAGPTLSSEYDQVITLNQTPPAPAPTLYITQGTSGAINTTSDIIIRIPNLYPILWDDGVTSVVIGGSGAGKVSTTVLGYEPGIQGVILDVTSPLAPGEYITVSGLRFTSFSAVAPPTNLQMEVGVPTVFDDKTIEVQGLIDVPFFTATATHLQVVLEWVSPPYGNCFELIVARRQGAAPTPLLADWFDTIPCPAVPGTKMGTVDAPPSNDTTYEYAIFVHDGAGTYSPGRFLKARPFDSTVGRVKWAYSTAASAMAPPGLRFSGGATVYAVSNDNVLHAMVGGGAGGTWPAGWTPFQLGAPAQARPPVVGFAVDTANFGAAFVGSQDGKVYAVDAQTGDEIWSRTIATMVQAAPAGNFFTYDSSAHDIVLVGTRNSSGANTMEALNVADGVKVWSFDNSPAQGGDGKEIGIISGSASVDYSNHRVIFASRRKSGGSSNTVWSVDFTSGAPQLHWVRDVGNVDGSPVLLNGVVYVGTNGGEVYALDASDGSEKWLSSLSLGNGPIKWFAFPQFGTSNFLVSTTDYVYSIADNGGSGSINLNWPMMTIPSPSTPLYVPGSTEVMVGGGDGKLYQLDVTNSIPAVSVTLGDGLAAVGMPTMDLLNSMIYIGTDQGVIYGVEFPFP